MKKETITGGSDRHKQVAAERAVDFINSGMVIGLGSGTTVKYAIERIGGKLLAGELSEITGIPSSKETEREALRNNISLSILNDHPRVDLMIDGADEVNLDLDMIKGGGGALFREKIIAEASDQVIIVVDESKISHELGKNCPLPVEVHPFSVRSVAEYIRELGAIVVLREDKSGKIFKTEQGNNIIDCKFGPIANPRELADKLSQRAGVIEHGLFLNMADIVIVGGQDGIKHLKR